jgi:hypothetical protein
MRQTTYLNVILTCNAMLLSGVLWTQLAGRSLMTQSAEAQSTEAAGIPGIPNAGGQREQMIRELQAMNVSLSAAIRTIEGGRTRVEVTNLGEIKLEVPEE